MRCTRCHTSYPMHQAISVCTKCQGLLEIEYDYDKMQEGLSKEQLRHARLRGLWRYAEALPVSPRWIVTMGEGMTPLVQADRLRKHSDLLLKADYASPTGSFKDRGSTVIVSKACELGSREIAIDSTGNAAASVSAYAARSDLRCFVFIPAHTETEKVVQISAAGATVVSVNGTRQDVHQLIEEAYRRFGWYYCGFMVSPYAIEGTKTIAYEVCEQLDWDPPDWIVFPVGTGSGIVGCFKGLQELSRLGLIRRVPKLVCVQPDGCAPISNAYSKDLDDILPVTRPDTVAEGLAVGNPPKGRLVLNAIRVTGGLASTVDDDETLGAARELAAREGQFVEVSSAASVAGAMKLIESGVIDERDRVVCELTGTGLKSSKEFARMIKPPITVEPRLEALVTSLQRQERMLGLRSGNGH